MKGSESISIYFYGGEPTIFPETINYFCNQIERKFQDRNITIDFNIYSNGTLFTDKLLNIITLFRFNNLQITLDGPQNNHDQRRPFKDGKSSFHIVYQNICKILDRTNSHVTLLMNFDRYNYKNVDELFSLFKSYSTNENFEMVFNPLFITNENKAYCTSHSFSTEKESSRIWAYLYKKAIKQGVRSSPLRIFDTGPCTFNRASNFVFDTEGNIFKCIGFLGNNELSVGQVNPKINDVVYNIQKQITTAPWDNIKCTECSFLPLCIGGCRFHSLVSNGNILEPFCHKGLIETCELELIKFLYKK